MMSDLTQIFIDSGWGKKRLVFKGWGLKAMMFELTQIFNRFRVGGEWNCFKGVGITGHDV